MHFLTASRQRIEIKLLPVQERPGRAGTEFTVSGSEDSGRYSGLLSGAARSQFEMADLRSVRERQRGKPAPAAFREAYSGRLRVVYKEIVVRFAKGARSKTQRQILAKYGLKVRARNRYVRRQCVLYDPTRKFVGAGLLDVANGLAELDEVAFAVPNFVSEYQRETVPPVNAEQWHLVNRARYAGQKAGEDVNALDAWESTTGTADIAVAVLDDGVDVDHPNLRRRILRNPDASDARDLYGRDFFVPDDDPEHFDPRPKVFRYPFKRMAGNDIHGTPCAGVVAASGSVASVQGIAPRCRILPVKIFHADDLASDARVANAIRYAARCADILSCSWTGSSSPDIDLAISEDAGDAWDGLGAAVFCASGNGSGAPVGYPASLPEAIAVGASTDRGRLAAYSNVGPEIDLVAPSSGGVQGIYTTDVSYENRGFNLGSASVGGNDGLHTDDFGGTSSATPLAAGVAALILSASPDLTRDEVRGVLRDTAEKIGSGYVGGHSPRYGYGRVDAEAAVSAALEIP